jgi:hypothetical protein
MVELAVKECRCCEVVIRDRINQDLRLPLLSLSLSARLPLGNVKESNTSTAVIDRLYLIDSGLILSSFPCLADMALFSSMTLVCHSPILLPRAVSSLTITAPPVTGLNII